MKKLLYKELALVNHPAIYLFALLSSMVLIPSYPYVVGISYFVFMLQISFQTAVSNKDNEFTAMLPISRKEVVLSKHLNVWFCQMLQLLVAIPFAFLTNLVVNTNGNPIGMDANFAFFGLALVYYTIFNFIFLTEYFKTGYKMAFGFLLAIAVYILTAFVFEVVIAFVPVLRDNLDAFNNITLQISVLIAGIIIYVLGNYLTYKVSVKNFEKVVL